MLSIDDLAYQVIHGPSGRREERMLELIERTSASKAVSLICDIAHAAKPEQTHCYMLTLTLDPKLHPEDTLELKTEIETRLHELPTRRKALKIVSWAYAAEHTKKGRLHWHIAVESKRRLEKDMFKHFAKKYGFIHMSRSYAQNPETAVDYFSKETIPTITMWRD